MPLPMIGLNPMQSKRIRSVLGPLAVPVVAPLVEVLLAVPAHQAVLQDRRAALPALLRVRPAIILKVIFSGTHI